ncbi:MAG TPA: TlpA disulfide reductase family protein [Jatrophihabitans sp.]|jgi:peroxiredoxin|nr:TlpA disulfide reductase family protein [Jatrophihabitans sp.]
MKRLFAALAAAALAVSMLSACTGKDAVNQTTTGDYTFQQATNIGSLIAVGSRRKAEDLSGTLLSGGRTSLRDDAGNVVLINFWATWCQPCIIETPQLDALYRRVHAKGVDFLGINTKDQRSKAESFVRDNDISYPIVFDEEGQAALQLGNLPAASLPFTVMIDKQQRVAAVYTGRLSPKDLEPVINKLRAES